MNRSDEILDEHLATGKRQRSLCRRIRFYTLMFTGVMAIIYLLLDTMHWPYGAYFLLTGLMSITLQSLVCFITMRDKTWSAAIRMIITLVATLYLILLFGGWMF